MEGTLRQQQSLLRRAVLPLLYAAALVLACNRIAGSYLIEIEDRYASLVLGGGYVGDGMVAVTPESGAELAEGDLVVVGVLG